jgi:3D (Asp-Asp-Asp) domain-containing protein
MRIHPAVIALFTALSLGACTASRRLPPYEPPLARTGFQNVRTTAYTDTESDHRQYGNRTALGGVLRAAPAPLGPRAIPVSDGRPIEAHHSYRTVAYVSRLQPFRGPGSNFAPPQIYGSAAADWARWPAGTIFRIVSTGQLYRVEDYGWALAGRNTIDLYVATPQAMNGWGVRQELIEIVQWGDPAESLRRLAPHTRYRHIKRMVLELEGHERAAAALD